MIYYDLIKTIFYCTQLGQTKSDVHVYQVEYMNAYNTLISQRYVKFCQPYQHLANCYILPIDDYLS